MKTRKNHRAIHRAGYEFTIHPKTFVFFDRKTGTQRFEVTANAVGTMPVDHVASLATLAVKRWQAPKGSDTALSLAR